jgi:hypothetical protein
MDLGMMIDTLYATRQERLDVSKKVDELKALETEMRGRILEQLDTMGMAKASGYQATCGIKKSIEPVPVDWDAIHTYIREADRFDLIQKRLSAPAWRGLLESGILVPGTEQVEVRDLSLTKSTRG